MIEPTNEHKVGEMILALAQRGQSLHTRFDICTKEYLVSVDYREGTTLYASTPAYTFPADRLAEGLALKLPEMIESVERIAKTIRERTVFNSIGIDAAGNPVVTSITSRLDHEPPPGEPTA